MGGKRSGTERKWQGSKEEEIKCKEEKETDIRKVTSRKKKKKRKRNQEGKKLREQ